MITEEFGPGDLLQLVRSFATTVQFLAAIPDIFLGGNPHALYVSSSARRNWCTSWRAAKIYTTLERGRDEERLWQCKFESQAEGKLKGRSNGNSSTKASA